PSQFRPDVGPDLEAIVLRALARLSENRYAGASQMAEVLQGWLNGNPKCIPTAPDGDSVPSLAPGAGADSAPARPLHARSRRRSVVALTAVLLLLGALIGSTLWWRASLSSSSANSATDLALHALQGTLEVRVWEKGSKRRRNLP